MSNESSKARTAQGAGANRKVRDASPSGVNTVAMPRTKSYPNIESPRNPADMSDMNSPGPSPLLPIVAVRRPLASYNLILRSELSTTNNVPVALEPTQCGVPITDAVSSCNPTSVSTVTDTGAPCSTVESVVEPHLAPAPMASRTSTYTYRMAPPFRSLARWRYRLSSPLRPTPRRRTPP